MINVSRHYEAYLDHMSEITILIDKDQFKGEKKSFKLKSPNREEKLVIKKQYEIEKHVKFICHLQRYIDFSITYKIVDEKEATTDLQIGAVIRTKEFDDHFYYEANDLGATYSKTSTLLKLWAPTATGVNIRLYDQSGSEIKTVKMERQERGVWFVELLGDYQGLFYTFIVCVNLVWREAVDPYVQAVSANGKLGAIVDLEKTRIETHTPKPLVNLTDAILYEVHIRDFSSHPNSGIDAKGLYGGWLEFPTSHVSGVSTGLSYLKELGVTHVEMLPFNDYEGVDEINPRESYNWGYNPLHFNAPEGSYSKEPRNPYKRIQELKKVIQTLHQNGLRVIMDVVYNHVYIKETSSFEKTVPGYYFRYDEHGLPSNGTGVGNDLASERLMVKKFILDSVRFWLSEYDVDGFRFDLMGILDIETMNAVDQEVRQLKQDALILGEGWDLQTPLAYERKAIIANANAMPAIAFFNDQFRDHIKGSTFHLEDVGFALGSIHKQVETKKAIAGSISFPGHFEGIFRQPHQTINYVESHDNHTMWDKLEISVNHETEEIRRARQRLATSIVLLSQGIPFLHSGQEFYRTKKGTENSYKCPDQVNWLDWDLRYHYRKDVEYIANLIKLRKNHPAFRLPSAELIHRHLSFLDSEPTLLIYQLKDVGKHDQWRNILVIHHNQQKHQTISLPNEGSWFVACTPDSLFEENKRIMVHTSTFPIDAIGTYVLYQW
ncbi:type I pullulanase [Metabacillus herbersteinensis]|uniref:Type I pullulanase n=1 Tax=Metabacillus herbersteinensis TaxID=283816 RepID=A0ABV6G9I7_9BACI